MASTAKSASSYRNIISVAASSAKAANNQHESIEKYRTVGISINSGISVT